MSLLQAPRGTSLDGGARVVGAGIGASSSVVEVRSSMAGFIGFFSLAVCRSVGDTVSVAGGVLIPSDTI
jgi:hypothetical protein